MNKQSGPKSARKTAARPIEPLKIIWKQSENVQSVTQVTVSQERAVMCAVFEDNTIFTYKWQTKTLDAIQNIDKEHPRYIATEYPGSRLIDFSTFICMGDSVFDATGGCNYICMYQRENPNVWDSKMKIAFCPQIISPRFSNAKSAKPPNITSCVTFSQEEKMAIVGFDNGELGQINLTQGSYRCSPAGDILFREPIVSISIGSSATTDSNRVAYIVQSGKVVLLEIIDDEYRICTDNTFNNVEDRFHRAEGFQFKCTVQFDPINFDLLLIKHDNHVYLYDCVLHDVIEEIELPHITSATFSRSGNGIALATLDGQLHVHKIVGNKFRDGKKYKWSEATQKEEYVTSIAPMFTNSSERYFVGTCGGRGTGSLYIIECK